MTTQQLTLFNALYLVALLIVAFLTCPTLRRIAGALAGAAVVSVARSHRDPPFKTTAPKVRLTSAPRAIWNQRR